MMHSVVILARDSTDGIYITQEISKLIGIDVKLAVLESVNKSRARLLLRKLKKAWSKKRLSGVATILINLPFVMAMNTRYEVQISKRFKEDIKQGSKFPYHKIELNSEECKELIEAASPDFIVVYGTSLLKSDIYTLSQVDTLNIHMGITSAYRGVKSEFWALREKKIGDVGLTVHSIDDGIDSGGALLFKRIEVRTDEDDLQLRVRNIENAAGSVGEVIMNYEWYRANAKKVKGMLFSTPGVNDMIVVYGELIRKRIMTRLRGSSKYGSW